jgi:hypothetical protein
MRRFNRAPKVPEWEVTLDLEQLDSTMTVAELQDIASRRQVYMRYFNSTMLTDKGWSHAMGITIERHAAYKALSARVPDSILNKAKTVSRKVKRCLEALRKGGI